MHYTFILLKGVLALNDYVIPGEVYAWAAVILLPINSAINPFMYTVMAIFGKAVGTFTVISHQEVILRYVCPWNLPTIYMHVLEQK